MSVSATLFCLFILFNPSLLSYPFHPTTCVDIAGFIDHGSGIGRLPIILTDMLRDEIAINIIPTEDRCVPSSYADINPELARLLRRKSQTPCSVVILCDMLADRLRSPYKKVPPFSAIKIAYSMLESTRIPQEWVTILNSRFNAVVVPDDFLKSVYQKSGVAKPIFTLPIPLYLEDFLNQPLKQRAQTPFIFSNTGAVWNRKNHVTLVRAFFQAFGNNPNVRLRLNARMGDPDLINQLQNLIRELGATTIELSLEKLNWKSYVNFISSSDCLVNLSKGEGFSISPYEAVAGGIPVIVSDNTAQHSLVKSGHVLGVKSERREGAFYSIFNKFCGDHFLTDINDAAEALIKVHSSYKEYLQKAQRGRTWVTRFLRKSLKEYYITLIKPDKIILSENVNTIQKGRILITSSHELYQAYKRIYKHLKDEPKSSLKKRNPSLIQSPKTSQKKKLATIPARTSKNGSKKTPKKVTSKK